MSVQIIRRSEGNMSEKQTFNRSRNDPPQIAYNSEGRISVRIPQSEGNDILIVFDRPLSRELIRFVKYGVVEGMERQTWCAGCGQELEDDLPF
jgi:hypothetical protein